VHEANNIYACQERDLELPNKTPNQTSEDELVESVVVNQGAKCYV
jgi:hypothetical protein